MKKEALEILRRELKGFSNLGLASLRRALEETPEQLGRTFEDCPLSYKEGWRGSMSPFTSHDIETFIRAWDAGELSMADVLTEVCREIDERGHGTETRRTILH